MKLFEHKDFEQAILRAVERQGYDTLSKRPKLSKMQKVGLMLGVLFGGA